MGDKKTEPVEVICPQCRRVQIVYLDKEKIPECRKCGIQMTLHDILKDGKTH